MTAISQTKSFYSDTLNKKRLHPVIIGESIIFSSTMTGLYFLWYKDYDQSHFHFFNDNNEWQGIDKMGHTITSYYVSKIGYDMMRFSGVEHKKAIWYGGTLGLFYLSTVEVLDGFSEEWGASSGDILANTIGTGLFIAQQSLWQEQRILIKVSYHPTDFAQYRPDLLGSNFVERSLKDYNGHSFWLSGNIRSFLPDSKVPKWLNVSLGYGANGMTGATENIRIHEGMAIPEFKRTKRYFLSLDIDLTRIETRSKALKIFINTFGFVKVPAPALEFNSQGRFRFHGLYL